MANIQREVGSGRGYTTIQAAVDSFNAKNFVSDGDTGEILIYPEGGGTNGEWTISATITGPTTATTDPTHGLTIRAADGTSFKDHANKRTNALRYNNANGVALKMNITAFMFNLSIDDVTFSGLQFNLTNATATNVIVPPSGTNRRWTIRDCICRSAPTSNTSHLLANTGTGVLKIVNCLVYGASINMSGSNNVVAACTIYNQNDNSDRGGLWLNFGSTRVVDNLITSSGATADIKLTPNGGTYAANSRNNGTVDGSGPATNLITFVAADVFESLTTDAEDFRIKASAPSNVKTGGFRIDTDTQDLDITGTGRSTSSPTIGAWESGVVFKPQICQTPNGAVMRGITP